MRCIQRFLSRRGPATAPTLHTKRPREISDKIRLNPLTPPKQNQNPLTPPAPRRGLGPEALLSAVWVVGAVYVTKTPPHPPCVGLRAGCPVCSKSSRAARRSQSSWYCLAHELGLGLSNEKRQLPSQRVTYTGIVIDTFHCTISIPPDKKSRLVKFL